MQSPESARFAHLRALDGLRGIAVLAVVLYHFAPDIAPGGFLGVVAVFALLFVPDRVDAQRFSLDGVAALFYVANWRFIASGQDYIQQFFAQAPSPLRHTWSLAIE